MSNKREYSRIPSDLEGIIILEKGDFSCRYENLSEVGFLVSTEADVGDMPRGDALFFQIIDDEEKKIISGRASIRWSFKKDGVTKIGCEVQDVRQEMYMYIVAKKARQLYLKNASGDSFF